MMTRFRVRKRECGTSDVNHEWMSDCVVVVTNLVHRSRTKAHCS